MVLTDRGGRILAANTDGSGVKELTGAGMDPVPSPDGSEIAFDEKSRVYAMKADGSGRVRLASGARPQWSPDGKWLAYQGIAEVYIVRPDGTENHRVASATQNGFSWSPDATALAYPSAAGISAVDVVTGARHLLVRAADAANPAWSPDGRRIAFARDNRDGTSSVYVAALDGSQPRLVGSGTDETIAWSPDSRRIAYGTEYFCRAVNGPGKVVVVDVSAARTVLAIPGLAGASAGNPSWSPDGTRLVFERANTAGSCLEDGADVWVINADGTGLSQVTEAFPFAGVGSPPTWWPGRLGVVPDPPIQTAALRTIARRSVRRGSYAIVGADRTRVAINRFRDSSIYSSVGVWRGSGRAHWSTTTEPGAETAGFAGARVYWTQSDFVPGYFFAYLFTAAHPGRRPRLLRSRTESVESPNPFFSVGGDGSLSVYTSHRSLWLLRGARSRRIRHERAQLSLLAVGGGRVLLQRSDRHVELISSRGKLLRTIAGRVRYVGGALSGRRLVLVGSRRISVYDARTGRLRARWPVGAPGVSPAVGFMYRSLLPYGDGSALHVLDVDTGHDVVVRIPGVTASVTAPVAPVGGAITKAGLIYTWTQTYSLAPGRMAVVPLHALVAALRAARWNRE